MEPSASSSQHGTDAGNSWPQTRRLTAVLMTLWFSATFFFIFFARELDQFHLLGWPISFYMAAQGMMLIYLVLVVVYIRRMRRIEQQTQSEPTHGE